MPASLIPSAPSSCDATISPLVAQTFEISSIATSVSSALAPTPPYSSSNIDPEDAVLAEELDDVPRELGRSCRSRPRAARSARAPASARARGSRAARRVSGSRALTSQSLRHARALRFARRDPRRTASSARSTRRSRRSARSRSPASRSRAASACTRPRSPRRRSSTSAAASSCRGFTDAHVHFPTWALAQTQVDLDGCALARRGARAHRAAPRAGAGPLAARLRLAERRLAAGTRADAARPRRGHGRRAGRADREGLPLALAQLGRRSRSPAATSRSPGGVVERDARGEPTGVLREEAAWRFKERYLTVAGRRVPRGDARGREARERARRDRGARQGRLARRAPALAAARGARARSRCASGSRSRTSRLDDAARARPALRASAARCCGSAT